MPKHRNTELTEIIKELEKHPQFKVIKGTSVLLDVNTVREVVLTCNLNWVYC